MIARWLRKVSESHACQLFQELQTARHDLAVMKAVRGLEAKRLETVTNELQLAEQKISRQKKELAALNNAYAGLKIHMSRHRS